MSLQYKLAFEMYFFMEGKNYILFPVKYVFLFFAEFYNFMKPQKRRDRKDSNGKDGRSLRSKDMEQSVGQLLIANLKAALVLGFTAAISTYLLPKRVFFRSLD